MSAKVFQLSGGHGPLGQILDERSLYPVYQPIVSLEKSVVHAHEALIRGPQHTPMHGPDALFHAADQEHLRFELEYAALSVILRNWRARKATGRLFVNISAMAFMRMVNAWGTDHLVHLVSRRGVLPRELVLEITEHERVADMDALASGVASVRAMGVGLALDDFGDGRSSLRLWSQIKPEVVKIDRYFVHEVSQHADKLKTIQALKQIASIFGSALVAEGIETEADLRVLRDLGISYGQGYFLGRPEMSPVLSIEAHVERVLTERKVSIFPEINRPSPTGSIRNLSIALAPTAQPTDSNDQIARIFLESPALHAVAVLEGERPIGIINRTNFMNAYSTLYYREVWGRKSCAMHTNYEPRIVERDHNVDELVGILTSQDQRYLADGFIVTENGRYIGLGTGEQLVRSVTEIRIEAARHANPLTFLPGNIPISQHIDRLLKKQARFVACYADLNYFKPFNDYYGYWRGDEMIRLFARLAMGICDTQSDFLGHVGGDDFILLFQSEDWAVRCEELVEHFNQQALELFDEAARSAGGIQAEDRDGVFRFFPCTTVSIGAAIVSENQSSRADEIANIAAGVKHEAKRNGLGLFVRRC